jgi:hypothetical protein
MIASVISRFGLRFPSTALAFAMMAGCGDDPDDRATPSERLETSSTATDATLTTDTGLTEETAQLDVSRVERIESPWRSGLARCR